jgi:DNA-binding NtrC family response regulator
VHAGRARSQGIGESPLDVVVLLFARGRIELIRQLIPAIKASQHGPEIVIVAEGCDAHEILELMRLGASDFIVPPIDLSATTPRLLQLLERAKWRRDIGQSLKAKLGLRLLVGQAPSFLAETRKIPLLASCDGRVLVLGETGTGKELFARAIHYLSPRMRHAFVPVNCGAIPPDLMENELFGHAKGAFTGATTSMLGLIHEAEGGTLFLDEIDCLTLLAQTKLLRFLQEGEYRPLGSSQSRQANVRVIAASNVNLEEAVKEGRLRKDLYYRLNIVSLKLPPLRQRREDIPLLATHFLEKYAHEFNRRVSRLSESAMQKLMLYDWPGNIRELENTIERAVMLSESDRIFEADIVLPDTESAAASESFQQSKARVIIQFERTYIQHLMATHQGNVTQAARAAKKNRRAFWALIRKHNIDVSSFRADKR